VQCYRVLFSSSRHFAEEISRNARIIFREIKEFKEAKQSTSFADRTTPQPVSERSFLILVEKKISECSGLHFKSLSHFVFKKACKILSIRQDCIIRSRSLSFENSGQIINGETI